MSNLPSWVFNWCPRNCRWVKYWPQCCYHPICARKKKKRCSWISNYFGIAVLTSSLTNLLFLLGQSCPQPASPPHGNWTCLQQEIPIPGASSFLDGNITSYKGMLHYLLSIYILKELFAALECRLDCHPGYVSQWTPIVTCVDGRFEPRTPSTYCCQPAAALLSFGDGSMEIYSSQSNQCSQKILKYDGFAVAGHTVDLLDNELILIGDKTLGGKFKYISIHSPRENLLAAKYSLETSNVKGSPYRHTSFRQGNKLTVLGGDQSSKARLNANVWTKINLQWKNQHVFSAFASAACRIKLTKDKFLIVGGILNDGKKKAVNNVLMINMAEETVEELPPMNQTRAHHSCELLAGEGLILISGGTRQSPKTGASTIEIVPDEVYNLTTGQSTALSAAASLGRYQHRLIRLGESIYAMGGRNGSGHQSSLVETFNEETRAWEDQNNHLMSDQTGDLAVTPFPLTAVDCVIGCKCGQVASSRNPNRVVNGNEIQVNHSRNQALIVFRIHFLSQIHNPGWPPY